MQTKRNFKMKYFKKSAKFYRFFEDAKLLELDEDNKKLGIVLNGKENILDIFDAGPYLDYNPYENLINIIKQNPDEEKLLYGTLVEDTCEPKDLNVTEIFQDIKNYRNENNNGQFISAKKNNDNKNLNNINKNLEFLSEQKVININTNKGTNENKNEYIYSEGQNGAYYQNDMEDTTQSKETNFARLVNIYNQKIGQNAYKNNKKNNENITNNFTQTRFHIYYLSNSNNGRKPLKKPNIKHNLLSVINLKESNILGFKFFNFFQYHDKDLDKYLQETEKYMIKSKLILVICENGLISLYKLKSYDVFARTRALLSVNSLQNQPFYNYKENYDVVSSINFYNPIIDFSLLDKPLDNSKTKERIRLITLHIDNKFNFWFISKDKNLIKISIHFSFELQKFTCDNFLMNSLEDYLVCFNKQGFIILLYRGQCVPYPIVYRYKYNDPVTSIEQIKNILYKNELILEDEEEGEKEKESEEKSEITKKKSKYGKKDKNNKKKEKKQKTNKKKNKKYKKYKTKNNSSEDSNDNSEKESKNEEEDEDEEGNKYDDEEDDFTLEEDKVNILGYDEIDEEDNFILEDYKTFVNTDIKLYLEDDKFLRYMQKPKFLSSESKILFVNYEVKTNKYILYLFDYGKLYNVEKDENFLRACLNEQNDILLKKLYISTEKIFISESPFFYFNPNNKDLIKNKSINDLKQMKLDFKSIADNIYQGICIRDGNKIKIIKISVFSEINYEMLDDDIENSEYIVFEQPTAENLKSNAFIKWGRNNTLFINSVESLFDIIKFTEETNVLGIPLGKELCIKYMQNKLVAN